MSYVIFKQGNGQYETKTVSHLAQPKMVDSEAQVEPQQQELSRARKCEAERKLESHNGK